MPWQTLSIDSWQKAAAAARIAERLPEGAVVVSPGAKSGRVRALADHALEVERRGSDWARRRALAEAFAHFIAYRLAAWDWFVTITFRDLPGVSLPTAEMRRREVLEFMADLEHAAEQVGWLVAEEFGELGGRFHCHGLVAGVAALSRKDWWRVAFERFGRSRIEPVRLQRAAAFYAAKYQTKQLGTLHLGGILAGVDLRTWEQSQTPAAGGRQVIAHSADVPTEFFHITRSQRGRHRCQLNRRR